MRKRAAEAMEVALAGGVVCAAQPLELLLVDRRTPIAADAFHWIDLCPFGQRAVIRRRRHLARLAVVPDRSRGMPAAEQYRRAALERHRHDARTSTRLGPQRIG